MPGRARISPGTLKAFRYVGSRHRATPLVRFRGVLAPRHSWRRAIVPQPPEPAVAHVAKKTVTPLALNVTSFWLFKLPLAYALANVAGWGPFGVFVAITAAYTAQGAEFFSDAGDGKRRRRNGPVRSTPSPCARFLLP